MALWRAISIFFGSISIAITKRKLKKKPEQSEIMLNYNIKNNLFTFHTGFGKLDAVATNSTKSIYYDITATTVSCEACYFFRSHGKPALCNNKVKKLK